MDSLCFTAAVEEPAVWPGGCLLTQTVFRLKVVLLKRALAPLLGAPFIPGDVVLSDSRHCGLVHVL